ncbi:phytochrome-like protein [Pseudoduganella lurida]|uniref:Phytochrome-like protein n=1 Tax=Pseudoduganella lurida TaxID=1036180 RepID=A0A562R2H8_9BURK|nr:GAF domain-containing protein [Pseudoduganella lurida]TWI62586.1 phytochrome-like protein [Pseudoduganella lurida]
MVRAPGLPLAQLALAPAVRANVEACVAAAGDEDTTHTSVQTTIGALEFDCITHRYLGNVLVEYEQRTVSGDVVGLLAVRAHGAIDSLRRQESVATLMGRVTQQVQALTGFDRVMAYRFRHDGSGDVVAEARGVDLASLLGMRYPASDIPAQARRLYLINTLRLIANVGATPVAMLGRHDGAPVDMSHGVLRSVSPIHLEYLRNMGVAASMSVSIVVNGELWGMLACHHMTARQVPHAIRAAVDVLVQVLAATVQWLEAQQCSQLIEQSMQVRTRLMRTLVDDDDVLRAILDEAAALCASLEAEALVVCQHGRILVHGDIDVTMAAAIIASLEDSTEELVVRQARPDWPDSIGDHNGKWVGMLALSFDPSTRGWLIALRAVLDDIVDEARTGNPDTRYLVASSASAIVDGDADRLTQVVSNLLSNAKNHGDAAHAIDIRLASVGRFAVLSIRNAAIPINEELARVLYDPFKRVALDNARNRAAWAWACTWSTRS